MSRAARADPGAPLSAAAFDAAFADLAQAGGPIVAAVSGGPDSTALMYALAAWRHRSDQPVEIVVATVDHDLRPESRREADAVRAAAEGLGLPHRLLVWSGRRPGPVSQAAARQARYRLLGDLVREIGARDLATAHTLDDQAETVLMRMAAGSGPAGLAGMRRVVTRSGMRHVRPFLHIPKDALVATCRDEGWAFTADPSNLDRRFARPRWRALMPALAAEGLDGARLGTLARRAARADAALAEAAGAALARWRLAPDTLDFRGLATEPEEIGLRTFAALMAEAVRDAPPVRLARLERGYAALCAAAKARSTSRRTLGGLSVALDGEGRLHVTAEAPRRRGRMAPVTEIAAGAPHSLGNVRVRA